MKTEVIMKRELFGQEISQKSQSEFFSATDLVRAGDKWRLANGLSVFNLTNYIRGLKTAEFIKEVESKYGKSIIMGRGRSAHTWVHPLIFIDIALAINPKLKVEVYEWIFDNLIKYRNDSGDSYKEMCAALFTRMGNPRDFHKIISEIAIVVKDSCGVKDWQTATEYQLKQRDLTHNSIKLLCRVLTDINAIVRIAIEENRPKASII
jgi:hypothetical protein